MYYNFQIVGLGTNINFLMKLSRHPEFVAANVHTDFIPQHSNSLFPPKEDSPPPSVACHALVGLVLNEQLEARDMPSNSNGACHFMIIYSYCIFVQFYNTLLFQIHFRCLIHEMVSG